MTKYGMVIDTDVCIGCDICLKACKDEFEGNDYLPYSAAQPAATYGYGPGMTFGWPNTPSTSSPWVSHGHNWMDVQEQTQGSYPALKLRYTPVPCFMCENAPCLKAATGGAIYRRSDGIVLIDPVKSVGQSQLVAACPYGRIYWNQGSNIPQKCTFCAHLVDQGKTPRCVEACPLSVITFGDLDDPGSAISVKKVALQPERMHPEYGASPLVFYGGLPKPFLGGKVVDGKTGKYIQGATVTLIAPDGTTSTATSDNYADFEFKTLTLGKMYTLQATQTGMYPKKMQVFLDQSKYIGKIQLLSGGV